MNNSATVKECEFLFQDLLAQTLLTLGNCYCGFVVVVVVLVCFGLKKGLGTGVGHIIRTVCMQSWKRDMVQRVERTKVWFTLQNSQSEEKHQITYLGKS